MAHPSFWLTKNYFYPIGNTSPVYLAQSLPREEDARILLLGCGDPRNILYTLHAAAADDALAVRRFDIECNDVEPAIFARNILLLSLVADEAYPTNASHVWNIFYHYFLDDSTHTLLIAQCRKLAQLSTDMETWRASEYSSFLRISSQFTLAELNRLWTLYAGTASLSAARKKRFKEDFVSGMKTIAGNKMSGLNTTSARSAGPLYTQALEFSIDASRHYWKTGVTFDSHREAAAATHVNPTFAFAAQGEGFVAHYGTGVLSAFHLAASLAPVVGQPPRVAPPTIFDIFQDVRQQFRSWCETARTCITQFPGKVILRFLLGDVLAVSRTLQEYCVHGLISAQQRVGAWDHRPLVLDGDDYDVADRNHAPRNFNVIDTSNLSDHLGMLNILLAAGPLLSREPWASLSTETLLSSGEDPQKSFTERLCGDPSTMFLLLDLAPISYISGFSTHSNTHELADMSMMKAIQDAQPATQFHERMLWKVPSFTDDNTSSWGAFAFNAPDLAALLHSIYCRMFWFEQRPNPLATLLAGELTIAHMRDQNSVHYCRHSFALLIGSLMKRICVDWDDVFVRLIDLLAQDPSLQMSVSMNHLQDFLCHLQILGLYTEPSWGADASVRQRLKTVGRLRSWAHIPTALCIVLSVPRGKVRVLEAEDSPGNALLDMRTEAAPFCNCFTSLLTAFGSVSSTGEGEDTRVFVKPDPKGKHGTSDVVVAAWVPAWLLSVKPNATNISLGVVSTPATCSLNKKLGEYLKLYVTSLSDTKRVFISAYAPAFDSAPSDVFAPPASGSKRPKPILSKFRPPRITLDRVSMRVTSITQLVEVEDPAAKDALAMPATKVEARALPLGRQMLCIGDVYKQPLDFPLLASSSSPRLRVARKSSYVEVVVPVPESGSHTPNDFPLARHAGVMNAWNLHTVNLDRLPALRIDKLEKLEWVNPHVSLAFSDRERRELELGLPKGPFTQFKESLHAMMMRFTGLQFGVACPVLRLRTSGGGADTIFFVTHLRLDVPAHTLVFDAFVLPLEPSITHQIGPHLTRRPTAIIDVNVGAEELVLWKRLLPALVERCRTWAHKDDCEYLCGAIPLSIAYNGVPICSCGKGIVTDAFKRREEWRPYAPHVTRVALSPLFALSYLEPVGGRFSEMMESMKGEPSWQSSSGAGEAYCKACGKALPSGKVSVCSACKSVSYCGKECQVADWKRHKHMCKK